MRQGHHGRATIPPEAITPASGPAPLSLPPDLSDLPKPEAPAWLEPVTIDLPEAGVLEALPRERPSAAAPTPTVSSALQNLDELIDIANSLATSLKELDENLTR